MPTKHQNITPNAAGNRCHEPWMGGSNGWLLTGRSLSHQISAIVAMIATAIAP